MPQRVEGSTEIAVPVETVYSYWETLENLPNFMADRAGTSSHHHLLPRLPPPVRAPQRRSRNQGCRFVECLPRGGELLGGAGFLRAGTPSLRGSISMASCVINRFSPLREQSDSPAVL